MAASNPWGQQALTPDQVEDLRQELLRLLARLERSLQLTRGSLEPVALDQAAFGRLSRMDALRNQGLTRNLKDREEARLAAILGGLQRLDAGTYGVCEKCRAPIGYGRLTVMPETARCTQCSEE